jgi:phosphoribosylformylglycinamidine synthase
MKIKVTVRLKDVVLDPQGQAVLGAAKKMGYDFVTDVRVGKVFEIEIDETENYLEKIEELSQKLLANPIIEEFYITEEGK